MADSIIITTNKGREKLAKASVGAITLPVITQIGFGTGGHSIGTGEPTQPDPAATVVPGEVLKKNIESYTFPIATTASILGILDQSEGNGHSISAYGLYDSAGDLIVLMHTVPSPKTAETRFERTINNAF